MSTSAASGLHAVGGFPRLSRDALRRGGRDLPIAPPRIVHVGIGAFHRAHQAWYTAHADDAGSWGITAFTGRSSDVANRLEPQGGVFTLVERGPTGDRFEHVGSIVRVVAGEHADELIEAVLDPRTAIITITITEAGYRLLPDGTPDLANAEVASDLDALRLAFADDRELVRGRGLSTPLGRLLAGLEVRRRYQGPPLAIVPCDNVPDNGGYVRRGLLALAERLSPQLTEWMASNVSFVSTSVDRITPRLTGEDKDAVAAATGWADAAPVVTEPFSDWVLSGEFPSGRPAWETAGARFVPDIAPFENRKLWLLNGAHTLMSFAGIRIGLTTVAEAIDDPRCRSAVESFWDEAERHLPDGLDIPAYREALVQRFSNPRIEHRLEQIAEDGLMKLRLRIVPIARAERAAGRSAAACAFAMAAWIDVMERGVQSAEQLPSPHASLLALIDAELARDEAFVANVGAALQGGDEALLRVE